jgi:hypothetical protein
MAKPPGERTLLIRQAITDHPGLGNTELAKLLNEQKPGHNITADDIAKQKLAVKHLAGARTRKARGKKRQPRQEQPARAASVQKPPVSGGLTAEDLGALLNLGRKAGGVDNLIRYLELFQK